MRVCTVDAFSVHGWGLLHSLLADVIADVVGAASKEAASATAAERDAWTLIASLATEPARENCMGAAQDPVQLIRRSVKQAHTPDPFPGCLRLGGCCRCSMLQFREHMRHSRVSHSSPRVSHESGTERLHYSLADGRVGKVASPADPVCGEALHAARLEHASITPLLSQPQTFPCLLKRRVCSPC